MKYLLLIPALLIFSLMAAWPLVELVVVSLHRTDFMSARFVGLSNYVEIWGNLSFVQSIGNSAWYIVLVVPMTVGGALGIALLVMTESKRWHDTTRILLYLPLLSAGVIIAQVWRWIFHIDGPLNWALSAVGVDAVRWFGQGATAIPAISLIVSSSTMGAVLIVILSAIMSINQELYDAAQIDGASWWQIKTRIVVPMIAPVLWIMALMAAIAGPQIWEFVYALAPFDHSATMAWTIYVEAFQMGRHGSAAAMSVVLLVMMVGLSLAKMRLEARE